MWCDNCLLFFPLRTGAMILGVISALYQFAGGIFLFKYGDFFFFHYPEAQIYGGFAMAQASIAIIAVIGFSMKSYLNGRVIFKIYPIILFLGSIRAGVMAWSLQKYKYRIVWTCNNGGVQWTDPDSPDYTPPLLDSNRLPLGFCKSGVDNFVAIFTLFFAISTS
ncbi:8606_t:CDS:2 [Entrophospora sp. SA101]|nr:11400_t:CDS:2 [Entrophospora sp. SA101]CAJ0753732.1 8606_t:CDS:2 [Entrophospora sp. SA101]CAJ0891861.1 17679_t:CDS:2 [Entrophospora sp. SA101]